MVQSMGSQRVRHNLVTEQQQYDFINNKHKITLSSDILEFLVPKGFLMFLSSTSSGFIELEVRPLPGPCDFKI